MKTLTILFSMAAILFLGFGCDEDDDDDCDCCYDAGAPYEEGIELLTVSTNIPNAGYDIYTCDDAEHLEYGPETPGKADIGSEFKLPASSPSGVCYIVQYYVVDGYPTPDGVKIQLVLGEHSYVKGEYTEVDAGHSSE